MKKKMIIGCSFLLGFIFVVHLFWDDTLNPQAKLWLDYFSQTPNLDKNAYLELIALGIDQNNAYEVATNKYLDSVSQFKKGLLDYDNQLSFPSITGLPAISDEAKYCALEKTGCFEQLLNDRALISNELQPVANTLEQFRRIAAFDNFDYLNNASVEPNFDMFALFRLSGIQIFYLIDDGKLNLAANRLANLIKLERKILQSSADGIFNVSLIINIQTTYLPLIQELHRKNFKNWDALLTVLMPLDMSEISMNKTWLQIFANGANTLKLLSIAESSAKQNSFYHEYQTKLKFKENMTNNDMYRQIQHQLIGEHIGKDKLLEEIKLVTTRSQLADESLKKDMENLVWLSIKNYRNITGTMLRVTVPPKIMNLYGDKISLDLRIILLNALIRAQTLPIHEVLNSADFLNPYTGDKPTLDENQICFENEAPVCLDWQQIQSKSKVDSHYKENPKWIIQSGQSL